ncbi:uncharacterized protein LOC131640132 [Vicia villosa]|uniref:uncharacterized protein LOC131599762 n=1 Tax=Vicia villosa TaxID=3911 RepID=UPI00273C3B5F|nr:uncharacterized protein LOC131599762 [Vicia villosa]XP_058728085.1 uncharacterized protein LOC131599849 [Vicia villosa]XP_058739768.1 uncharacterized protein LOC131611965 [Vicia villosa]XP_058766518.1 uncharacterized protein LOC131640132 [Vicia villosa]
MLRVMQIYQNTPPPPFIYPNSNQKQAKAKICANTLPRLHQGSNHIAIQHSKAHKSLNLNMSDNQPARIRQGRETQTASAREGMGGAKGRKGSSTSCSRGVKEVKEKKKVLTGSASRPLGVHGSDVQAQSSGVRVMINADGSETEWDEDWYNYLHSEEFARRAE